MMIRRCLGVLAAVFVTGSAVAQEVDATPASCSATFEARRVEARAAVNAQAKYMKDFNRVMPWYFEHCRQLTPLEIAIHKIDDPVAFVCDTAKGRPAGLTSRFVYEHPNAVGIDAFQEHAAQNMNCSAHDPISLDLSAAAEPDADDKRAHQLWALREQSKLLEVTCFGAKGLRLTECSALRESTQRLLAELTSSTSR